MKIEIENSYCSKSATESKMCIGMILLAVEYSRAQIDFFARSVFTFDFIIRGNYKAVKIFLKIHCFPKTDMV